MRAMQWFEPISAKNMLVQVLREPARMSELSLRDWDMALRLARSANLIGRLAQCAQSCGLLTTLPAEIVPHLQAATRLIEHQQQAIAWECQHLEAALKPLNIPVVLLKGAAYVMSGRRAAQGRLFGDVDLLVPRPSLDSVEAALMLHGWATGKADPYDQRYYRRWMHELPPMAHMKRGTVVDVHHNILPLTTRDAPDPRPLIDARIPLQGTTFSVLAPCDMVIHSATHLFHEGELKNGLRDLYDLDSLLVEFSGAVPDFWLLLTERARQLGLVWPLALALRYTQAILGTDIPQTALDAVTTHGNLGRLRLACLDAVYHRAFAPDHPLTSTAGANLARSVLYLRSHALRMPAWQLTFHLGRKTVLRMFRNTSRVN